MVYTIQTIKQLAIPIARRYGVETLSLFGSYARGEADESSDIDFLLGKGKIRGLLDYCSMINDLEETFQRHVDMVERSAVKDAEFLREIERDEVLLYEQ